ncbi:MAG: ABC transporter permease [Oscillatoria sp. PMC 1068.18]|nr:ABC transporter permease [Oscillatoria sp. PMC 1076.18]MEC4989601.1 ABC transporter permease [Oscillatoria sp. PMC 1068.18]
MLSSLIDRVGEWNPQLFRELKGRLKMRPVAIIVGLSGLGQVLLYLFYQGLLPTQNSYDHRYCLGAPPPDWYGYQNGYTSIPNNFCQKDAAGNLLASTINSQLWWLDLFVCMSIIGIFALLVVGVYMLISDLSREERRGTLGFIRLSPQSTASILTGKILGVPVLLYLFGLLALPLHLAAGLVAGIPLHLILSFYVVLAASCAFFYSGALVYGLVSSGLGNFQAWFASGAVLFFVSVMTAIVISPDATAGNAVDWLIQLYPGITLPYLVDATGISQEVVNYLSVKNLAELQFFGLNLWSNSVTGIGFTCLNYLFWSYWFWQGLQRRFHDSHKTLLSKLQSYLVTASLTLILLGFTLQKPSWGDYPQGMFEHFVVLFSFGFVLFLGAIALLSPHRQTLYDWARFRHQNPSHRRNLMKDLLWGEKSPATLAIAVNLAISCAIIVPCLVLLPLKEYKIPFLFGLLLTASITLLYAAIAQSLLLMKTRKRALWAAGTVSAAMILPLICFAVFRIDPNLNPGVWLFSFVPVVATQYAQTTTVLLAILGEWTAILLVNFQMTKQLQKAGESETKALLSSRSNAAAAIG